MTLVPAYCAGRAVEVAVRASPPDHRRVSCASCGAQRSAECQDIENGGTLWIGHASRQRAAARMFDGEGAP